MGVRSAGHISSKFENRRIGAIEEVSKSTVGYLVDAKATIIGIGERLHSARALVYMFIPYLLPALVKAGFKQLLSESLYEDTEGEIKNIYAVLDKETKKSTEEKIELVKETILGDSRKFRVLSLQYAEHESKYSYYKPNDFLLLIVKAHELGVKLYGMADSKKMQNADDEEQMYLIGDSGRRQANRLAKNGKLIIFAGDAHVSCKGLDVTLGQCEHPERIIYGTDLFNNLKYNYINLTVFCGTEKFVDNEPEGFLDRGREFYKKELRALEYGKAIPILIQEEDQHRIMLLYNNNNDIPYPLKTGRRQKG